MIESDYGIALSRTFDGHKFRLEECFNVGRNKSASALRKCVDLNVDNF